jgi:hypothetical protein
MYVLSKEVINKWKGVVDDNSVYEDKLKEKIEWIEKIEENM